MDGVEASIPEDLRRLRIEVVASSAVVDTGSRVRPDGEFVEPSNGMEGFYQCLDVDRCRRTTTRPIAVCEPPRYTPSHTKTARVGRDMGRKIFRDRLRADLRAFAATLDPHSPRRLELCPVCDRTMLPDNNCLPRFGVCCGGRPCGPTLQTDLLVHYHYYG